MAGRSFRAIGWGRVLVDGRRDIEVVLLDQTMRERGVEQSVNVHVLGDQSIVLLVILPTGGDQRPVCRKRSIPSRRDIHWFLHLLQLLLGLVVLLPSFTQRCQATNSSSTMTILPIDLPLVSRIVLPDQAHTPDLWRLQHLGAHAHQPLQLPVGLLSTPSLMYTLLVIRPFMCPSPSGDSLAKLRRVAEVRRGPALDQAGELVAARRHDIIREG